MRKHGWCGTRIYKIWWAMIRRCYCETDKSYPYYGGRGIGVCEEWKNSVEVFCQWAAANGYSDDLTIDRIDSSKDYCPSNCRWVTMQSQFRNRRSNVWITVNGICMVQQDWAKMLGVHPSAIVCAEKRGISKEEYILRKLNERTEAT